MRLALVRHSSVQVASGVCYGRLDLELAETAAAEFEAIACQLGALPDARLWTSPARRCRRLAEALERSLHTHPVADDRLREISFGTWEGAGWDTIGAAELAAWAADPVAFAAPGGETGGALIARVSAFFRELPEHGASHVIVSHGGPLRVLAALAAGRAIDLLEPSLAIGGVQFVTVATSTLSAAHSATCWAAPSVSPV